MFDVTVWIFSPIKWFVYALLTVTYQALAILTFHEAYTDTTTAAVFGSCLMDLFLWKLLQVRLHHLRTFGDC